MKRVCVYCGSRSGQTDVYAEATHQLAVTMVAKGIDLVYGGGGVGLMGKMADTILQQGGKVTGVIPKGLFKNEVEHVELTEIIYVKDMHQRKAKMAELADGFIALPGGYGTMEELLEVITWRQLQIYNKPIGLLNTEHYYDKLLEFISHANQQGFVRDKHLNLFISHSQSDVLLEKMLEES